jgi:hypothetical protein
MNRVIIITSPSKDSCLLIIIRHDLRYYFKCAEHESKKNVIREQEKEKMTPFQKRLSKASNLINNGICY